MTEEEKKDEKVIITAVLEFLKNTLVDCWGSIPKLIFDQDTTAINLFRVFICVAILYIALKALNVLFCWVKCVSGDSDASAVTKIAVV